MIQYTIEKRTVTTAAGRVERYYPKIVRAAALDFDKLVALLAERTTLEPSEVSAFLLSLARGIRYYVTDSFVVEIEGLGIFSPTLSATPQDSSAAVTGKTIVRKSVNYRPTAAMKQRLRSISLVKADLDLKIADDDTGGSSSTSGTTTRYTINAVSANTAQGTVSGGGTYDAGTVVTLVATPASGYTFSRWSDGSTQASRQITVSADATYTAEFAASSSGGLDD